MTLFVSKYIHAIKYLIYGNTFCGSAVIESWPVLRSCDAVGQRTESLELVFPTCVLRKTVIIK